MTSTRLVHHELCFGCGRTNLFGLLMDVEQTGEGRVSARAFIKQDHQGPERGAAHEGVVAAALSDAMSLACGHQMRARSIEVQLQDSVPIGAFLSVEATVHERADGGCRASAIAAVDEHRVASARGDYAR